MGKLFVLCWLVALAGCDQGNALVWDKNGKAYTIPYNSDNELDTRWVTRVPDADRNPNKCVP